MKTTDYPEQRFTRGQALKKALVSNAAMFGWPTALLLVLLVMRLDERYLYSGIMPPKQIPLYHSMSYVTTLIICGWAFLGGTLVQYLQNRGTPSRDEVKEKDRRKFNALMLQYPEFQTAHQTKIEDAADELLDKLEALSVNIPEMKALRDALTWR
jgi:hypothetical protein